MPAHLSTSSSTFPPPPAARHRHSALSIWLSVDPMADKYPSTSPYTYCANNPVRLVDVDGRTWETPDDENKANEMRNKARQEIANNNMIILRLNLALPQWSSFRKALVKEYENRNILLNEGLCFLDEMEQSNYFFHFNSVNDGDNCYSTKYFDDNHQVYIDIFSDSYIETRWHESIHVGDWLCKTFDGMTNDGKKIIHDFGIDPTCPYETLGHYNDGGQVERHAYQSEFAFSRVRFSRKYGLNPAFFLRDITGEHRIE